MGKSTTAKSEIRVYNDRPWLAGVAATFLVLSKASGLLVWPVAMLAAWGVSRTHPQRFLARHWQSIALPTVAFGTFAAYKALVRGRPVLYQSHPSGGELWTKLLPFHEPDSVLTNLFQVFVLNFAWLPCLLLLAGVVGWIARNRRGGWRWPWRPSQGAHAADHHLPVALASLLLVLYVLTRYMPWTNIRYLLPAIPLFLWATGEALVVLSTNWRLRLVPLAVCCVLFSVGLYRSIDPVSRAIVGTIPFGDHDLYDMTSLTGECCAVGGRDQLVYNLEFIKVVELQDEMLAALRPKAGMPIGRQAAASFWQDTFIGRIDPIRHRRTLGGGASFMPRFVDLPPANPRTAPQELDFLDFGGLFTSHFAQLAINEVYEVSQRRLFDRDGYQARLLHLKRRRGSTPPFE